jgi:hypothetical protein
MIWLYQVMYFFLIVHDGFKSNLYNMTQIVKSIFTYFPDIEVESVDEELTSTNLRRILYEITSYELELHDNENQLQVAKNVNQEVTYNVGFPFGIESCCFGF